MSKRHLLMALFVLLSAGLVSACGDDDECDAGDILSCGPGSLCKAGDGGAVCVPGCLRDNPASCASAQACEEVEGSDQPLCFPAYELRGKVTNALDAAPIAGARVAARDGVGMAGGVTDTREDGTYAVKVPVKRKADGTPAQATGSYTLRADAKDFQTFPGGLRPALPIDVVASAVATGNPAVNVVENAATNVVLFKLPDSARGTIVGRVDGPQRNGALVVAGNTSGLADAYGNFAIFNVPEGAQTVRGYTPGVQLTTADVTVPNAGTVSDVVLSPLADKPLATVAGNIINNANGAATSVVLAVKATFNTQLENGEVPRGLRVEGVTGTYSIANVPDGEYVVLASLENDGVVRATSDSGNTALVFVAVAEGVPTYTVGGATTASPSFKIENAIETLSPGANAPETLTASPSFSWVKFSSTSSYTLRLFNALGDQIWEKAGIPGGGGGNLTVAYPTDNTAPALQDGMMYQFRVLALDNGGAVSSRTEDLRGVFTYDAP